MGIRVYDAKMGYLGANFGLPWLDLPNFAAKYVYHHCFFSPWHLSITWIRFYYAKLGHLGAKFWAAMARLNHCCPILLLNMFINIVSSLLDISLLLMRYHITKNPLYKSNTMKSLIKKSKYLVRLGEGLIKELVKELVKLLFTYSIHLPFNIDWMVVLFLKFFGWHILPLGWGVKYVTQEILKKGGCPPLGLFFWAYTARLARGDTRCSV